MNIQVFSDKITGHFLFFILFIIIAPRVWTQKSSSPVLNPNLQYVHLQEKFRSESDNSQKVQIATNYLKIAKQKNDTIGMANLYFFLSKFLPDQKTTYADSIIRLTENSHSLRHPASGYLIKGNIQYELGNYKEALDFYLPALKLAKENNNEILYLSLKFNIALLKNNINEREEALKIFKEYIDFLEDNPKYKTHNYNNGIFAIADSYMNNGKLDSAAIYINKGIQETLKSKDSITYSLFVTNAGIYYYFLNDYAKALDSLEKGKILMKEYHHSANQIAIGEYYLGSAYKALGKTEKSMLHFKQMDSILITSKDIIPEELPKAYDHLIDYYKSKKNTEQQLLYINKLLKIDSIKHTNELYLTKNLSTKYDTFELISEKESLIKKLEKDKSVDKGTILTLILLSIALFGLITYFFRRNLINKKRFTKLIEKLKEKELESSTRHKEKEKPEVKDNIDTIPKDVVEEILLKLDHFEQSHMFAKKHYTQNILAKELNTNSTYLSKIINVHKHMNFANYLNNLRIDYAITELTSNKSLRSYTIQAIAEEVGFKNAQSFSSAFHKKTGIYPSYFIKNIKS